MHVAGTLCGHAPDKLPERPVAAESGADRPHPGTARLAATHDQSLQCTTAPERCAKSRYSSVVELIGGDVQEGQALNAGDEGSSACG